MAGKLRVVLVGCGGITRAWLNAETTKKRVQIVGLVDIKKKNAKALAERYGYTDVVIGTDLAKVLKTTKPDAVYDCTVPEAHCAVTLTALKHGCHVLGEKPMADSIANARKMVAAAKKAGKLYTVTQNYRYQANIQALRRFLDSGAIGKVTTVQSNFFLDPHFGGFREQMQHVLLVDMAIHTFDAARFLSGAAAKSVYCTDWNPAGSWFKHGASAVAVFEMSDNIVYTYQGSWCAEGCNTGWNSEWRIIGSKGTVLWDGGAGFRAETMVKLKGGKRKKREIKVPQRVAKSKCGAHDGIIRQFVAGVRNGTEPETICTDNIKSVAMVYGAIESAEKGRKITLK